ncbi:thioredoxin family protein [Streptomyces vinaceus]|uniref:thioredoxin family protein n=1 Tax=Streptomyces vinaceus TaxID=1960 RepID=UPI003694669E
MSTTALTADNFDKVTSGEGIVLVLFCADWSSPCRRFTPVFDMASEKHADVLFGTVDTEAEPALPQRYGHESVPVVMAFRDGITVFSEPGVLASAALDKLIADVQTLNMDEVRAKIAG